MLVGVDGVGFFFFLLLLFFGRSRRCGSSKLICRKIEKWLGKGRSSSAPLPPYGEGWGCKSQHRTGNFERAYLGFLVLILVAAALILSGWGFLLLSALVVVFEPRLCHRVEEFDH